VLHKKLRITVALPVWERRLRYCERLVSKRSAGEAVIS
jgi:hypothetical protein